MTTPPSDRTNIPVPDPTTLTTAALDREIAHLRELFTDKLTGVRTSLQEALVAKDLRDSQRFEAQSAALDAARIAADLAVAAALTSTEKAVTKAETAAEKRFDAVAEKVDDLRASTSALDTALQLQIAAVQAQVGAIVARGGGKSDMWGYVAAGIALLLAAAGWLTGH